MRLRSLESHDGLSLSSLSSLSGGGLAPRLGAILLPWATWTLVRFAQQRELKVVVRDRDRCRVVVPPLAKGERRAREALDVCFIKLGNP